MGYVETTPHLGSSVWQLGVKLQSIPSSYSVELLVEMTKVPCSRSLLLLLSLLPAVKGKASLVSAGLPFVCHCLASYTRPTPDVSGTGAGAITEGGKKGKGKGKGKGKQATDSHLQTTYRPGNANYRIQKVGWTPPLNASTGDTFTV